AGIVRDRHITRGDSIEVIVCVLDLPRPHVAQPLTGWLGCDQGMTRNRVGGELALFRDCSSRPHPRRVLVTGCDLAANLCRDLTKNSVNTLGIRRHLSSLLHDALLIVRDAV